MQSWEVNFDGLVGPTHNYAGLAYGNLASASHKAQDSNPREAARQGLDKMFQLHNLGLKQAVLPPHARPETAILRRLGFLGDDAEVLEKAAHTAPELLAACYSASSMWTANAATVSPSADTLDGKIHFTPANLISHFHRSLEADTTACILKAIFQNPNHFKHHAPLPASSLFADEGAANHCRFALDHHSAGVELFVYGRSVFQQGGAPATYPARQTLEASQAIARKHRLAEEKTLFAQQNPAAIDQGVFHNDVIAVSHGNLLFCHKQAFVDQSRLLLQLNRALDNQLQLIEVKEQQISVADAVGSYLFNSQLLSLPSGETLLLTPTECQQYTAVADYLNELVSSTGPIDCVQSIDLRQSMHNGGGPACLRLRVVMNQQELESCNPAVLLSESLYSTLDDWIGRYYRDRLNSHDLADPQLLMESRCALDELTQILQLGSIYPFQRV